MKGLRLFLGVTGGLLIVAAIVGYFADAAPRPTLYFAGSIGLALVFLHHTVLAYQRMQGQK